MRGDNCFSRNKKGTVVSQVEKKGLQFCIEFNLQALHMSEYVNGLPAKDMYFQSAMACVSSPERGPARHVSGIIDRTSPENQRPHADLVQNHQI